MVKVDCMFRSAKTNAITAVETTTKASSKAFGQLLFKSTQSRAIHMVKLPSIPTKEIVFQTFSLLIMGDLTKERLTQFYEARHRAGLNKPNIQAALNTKRQEVVLDTSMWFKAGYNPTTATGIKDIIALGLRSSKNPFIQVLHCNSK